MVLMLVIAGCVVLAALALGGDVTTGVALVLGLFALLVLILAALVAFWPTVTAVGLVCVFYAIKWVIQARRVAPKA